MKETQGKTGPTKATKHTAKINRYFSTNTNREEKKESKFHEGPFYSLPKEKV